MSDGLFQRDTMFSARLVPWHGKGFVDEREYVPSDEVLDLAGINDTYRLIDIPNPFDAEVPWNRNRYVVRNASEIHTDELVSVVGADYEIVQPQEFKQMMDYTVQTDQGHYTTGGTLFDRTRMWLAQELPNEIHVSGDKEEKLVEYLLGVNSFDMSLAVGFYITMIRPVCNNTISLGIGTARRSVTRKHTKNVREGMSDVSEILGLAKHYRDVLQQVADLLVNVPFTSSQVEQTLDMIDSTSLKYITGEKKGESKTKGALTLASNKRDEFVTVLAKRDDLARIKDTAWGFFQAGIEMNDHHGRFHKTDTSDKWDNRMSNVFGMGSTTNFTGEVFGALDTQLGVVKQLGLAKK